LWLFSSDGKPFEAPLRRVKIDREMNKNIEKVVKRDLMMNSISKNLVLNQT